MIDHIDLLLADLALGTLEPEDARRAEAHLAECARCAEELAAFEEIGSLLGAELAPIAPTQDLRERIVSSSSDVRRFGHYDQRLADHFDIPIQQARELLDGIDRPESWKPGPLPGIQMIIVQLGGKFAGSVGALVRVAPGTHFPWHRHTGEEVSLMLQGSCIDSSGEVYRAGCVTAYGPESAHDFVVEDDAPYFVFASRSGGFQIEPPPGS